MISVPSLRKPSVRPGHTSWKSLIDGIRSPAQAFGNQNLSKLGDALLNLIYSLSLSQIRGRPDGAKIPNRTLARAIDESHHRSLIPKGSDKHIRGDLVEAIFAYAWLKGLLDIRECADFLSSSNRQEGRAEDEGFSKALAELLDTLLLKMGIPEDA